MTDNPLIQNVNNARARFRGMLPTLPILPDITTDRGTRLAKRRLGIQLTPPQIRAVIASIKPPANVLVFGLGNDTPLWIAANKGGRTVFIENNEPWMKKMKEKVPNLEAYLVTYTTDIAQWKDLIYSDKLDMPLPPSIVGVKWGTILVDAPEGWKEGTPGRMQSIYASTKLASAGTHIFVHDCNRQVEQVYCDKYLGNYRFIEQVGTLRHYQVV